MPRIRLSRRDLRRRHAGLAAVLASSALLAALVACSDDPDLTPGPPAPPQATSSTIGEESLPQNGDPIVTVTRDAQEFASDPVVAGFREFVRAITHAYQTGESEELLFGLVTGTVEESIRIEFGGLKANGWRLVGTPVWEIVDVQVVDGTHRRILACEDDSAAYQVDANGAVVRPFEDRWLPSENRMLLVDGAWILEAAYRGDHVCDGES